MPIQLVLCAFAAGVALLSIQAQLPPCSPAIAIVAALGCVAAFAAHSFARQSASASAARRSGLLALTGLTALLAGFGYAAWRAEVRLVDALPAALEGVDVRLTGIVDDLPRRAPQGVRFALHTETVHTADVIVPRRLSLAWYAAPPLHDGEAISSRQGTAEAAAPALRAGERWTLTVRLSRPHGSVNPSGFDLEAWLLERGVRATGYVREDAGNRRLDAFAGRWQDRVQQAREQVRERIATALPAAPYAGVLAALSIGDQRAIPESQWQAFNRTGISHLVSISGLHVTVFATLAGGLAFAVLRRACWLTTRCPARRMAALFGLAAAAGYVALSGAEIPALRTLAMLAVGTIGLVVGRPGSGRVVWLWSLAVVLAADPFAPLAAGFWLSFGAVGLLIYGLSARLHATARKRGGRLVGALAAATRTQYVVSIGLLPATLAMFGQVSLVSPLANAVAIPLVTFVVVPAALLASALQVEAAWTIAHATLVPLMRFIDYLAALPDAAWQQHAPPPWAIAAGIVATILLLAPRAVPGRALGLAWLAPIVWVVPPAPGPGAATVTILDVGQGLAVAVRTHRHALLYDTGPRFSDTSDAGARIVAPFLRAAGMPRLSALIVSHRDTDHAGGALSLLATVPIGWLASSLDDDHPIVARVRHDGRPATRCEAGQQWEWDGVRFAFLHPDADVYADPTRKSNDRSCVLRIETAHGRVLIAGDVEARSEYALLLRAPEALRAEAIVVPHHGSRTSSTAAFVAAVAPALAVVSAGYRNRFGHPRADVLARYRMRGAAIARSDREGAVVLRLADARIEVTRWRVHARRYWHDRLDDPTLLVGG